MITNECVGLIGLDEDQLSSRLGRPVSRRRAGDSVWLIFQSAGMSLRVRCEGREVPRVVSWTATFLNGHATLEGAARVVGLWPAAAPDAAAAEVSGPLVRRPLPCRDSERVHSLTATVRGGLFSQVSVFDEPPDWL